MRSFLLSLLLICSSMIHAQSHDEAAIRELMDKQSLAWNNGDIAGFMEGYWKSDSLTFIGSRGVTHGWTATLNNYKKGYPDTASMGKLTFTLLNLKRLSNKYYYVIGKWFL